MNKQSVLRRLENIYLGLQGTPEANHILHIHYQLSNDQITPEEVMKKLYQMKLI